MNDHRIHEAAARGFEAAVERYRRGRPGYPDDAVAYVVGELRIADGRDVVEIGAGPGKLTERLVRTGARITAVEPVPAMREALGRVCPTVDVLDGTAEAIPCGDASADAVVAAQAFHWFDGDRALAEVHRVLRPGGRLGLLWNVRDEGSDWAERITAIFDRLAGDGPRYRTMAWREPFERTDLFGPLHHQVAYHLHELTRAAFLDRILSVSYVASAPEAERDRVVVEVTDILASDPELAKRDTVVVPYRTDVFWTQRRG
ncbi:MAG: class I SAM-dependent methyltransferase [Actinomycetota bacterium]